MTSRGQWYLNSWKGDVSRSGGIAGNIGIHFFDLLLWLFGRSSRGSRCTCRSRRRWPAFSSSSGPACAGSCQSTADNLPFQAVPGGPTTYRSITVDGEELEFSDGFTDLHTQVYREILAGRGFGVEEARPAIVLTHGLRNATPVGPTPRSHDRALRKR